MTRSSLRDICLVLAPVLLVSNIAVGVLLYMSEASWSLKYSSDMLEASHLLSHYQRAFTEDGSWPDDIADWAGVSSIHLVSTNVVEGRRVHSFASDYGGAKIEIREAVDGSPYLTLEADEEKR